MIFLLTHKDKIAAKFDAVLSTSGYIINFFEIINKEEIPYVFKQGIKTYQNIGRKIDENVLISIFEKWIGNRNLSVKQKNFDDLIFKYMNLDCTGFGRMFGFENLLSALTENISYLDGYGVSIEKNSYQYFIYENINMNELFYLEHCDNPHEKILNDYRNASYRRFKNMDYTFPTSAPTHIWYKKEENALLLTQKISIENSYQIQAAELLNRIFPEDCRIVNNEAEFSFNKNGTHDFYWLNEILDEDEIKAVLISFLQNNKICLQNRELQTLLEECLFLKDETGRLTGVLK